MENTRFDVLPVEGVDVLGEGPWWDVSSDRLVWVDIKGRRIRRSTLDGVEEDPVVTPADVGFAIPDHDGGLVVGLRTGLSRWTAPNEWDELWRADYDSTTHRINDGKTDRAGRLWFGTMHDAETEASSTLYRFADGHCLEQFGAVTTSNGLGWSPDDRTLYYTDSIARRIYAFDFDLDEGRLSNRKVFAEDPKGYIPDGLTVDADGAVWSAKWDGGKVVRYRPDGGVDAELRLPVRRPTSVAFVGTDLGTLAVTSASLGRGSDEPLAGSIFLVASNTTGRPESPVRRGQ